MLFDAYIEPAATAPSADNSQPWQVIATEQGVVCQYKHRAIKHDPFGPKGHGNLLAAGTLLENFNTLRPDSSEKPQVIINEAGWKFTVDLSNCAPSPSPQAKGLLLARHTNRSPFKPLPSKEICMLSHSFSSRSIFLNDQESIGSLSNALIKCSMARFNDQTLHEWLFSSLRWTLEEVNSGTGLDINTLHLPVGGRQLMHWIAPWERMQLLNRFGIYRILAAADVSLFRQAPGIIAFVGGRSPEDILDCGQLIQRTWIALNSVGIAVHPYYAITDLTNRLHQNKLDSHWSTKVEYAHGITRETLQLRPDEQVHMLFRIGMPTSIPVKSRRLPLSSLFG